MAYYSFAIVRKTTATGEYYEALLDRLKEEIKNKTPHLTKESPASPRKHTGSHINESDGKIE